MNNQKPFFKLNEPLSDHDESLLAEIEALPPERQQDAIAMLFGAMVYEYESATPVERENMNPFVRFFAEMAIVQEAETETPQHFKNTEAAVTVVKFNLVEAFPNACHVNQ